MITDTLTGLLLELEKEKTLAKFSKTPAEYRKHSEAVIQLQDRIIKLRQKIKRISVH